MLHYETIAPATRELLSKLKSKEIVQNKSPVRAVWRAIVIQVISLPAILHRIPNGDKLLDGDIARKREIDIRGIRGVVFVHLEVSLVGKNV